MIIAVFLHMTQVFIYGAYKKPREATWIAGTMLLLLTLAFGLTGYLLPWDNRAYWGTIVTTRIMASVPFAGPILSRLIGSTHGIGVVTFARFYSFHTILLPAATVLLITIHVSLVRRHGVMPAAGDVGARQRFYPKQAFRDALAVYLAFAILFAIAIFLDAPLERIADPTDITYTPRPEWYFLFLFQLLKLFQGRLEVIGTVVLPTLAVLSLVLLPFFPRVHTKILHRRTYAALVAALVFSIWAGLTGAAVWTTPRPHRSPFNSPETASWTLVPPEEIAGFGYFRASRCDSCHNLLSGAPKPGPNLGSGGGLQHPREWLTQHFRNATQVTNAATSSTHFSLSTLNALSLFVENVKPDSVATLETMPSEFIAGAQTYIEGACGTCHKINGSGGGIGPALNGLTGRRTEQWVKAHFAAPQRLSPGSIMPPYHFAPAEEQALMKYLFALPD
jgi:ubiquinol-cytochrome c reductase cytochrome b subunit